MGNVVSTVVVLLLLYYYYPFLKMANKMESLARGSVVFKLII
jgi:cellobiose-specific phosphotransferase system component IIC